MENRSLLIEFNRGIPKTQKEIDTIKKDFLLNDINYQDITRSGGNPILDLNKTNIQIEVSVGKSIRIVQDEFGFEEEEVDFEYDLREINFYEEFEKALENVFENYCKKFLNVLDRKGVYTFKDIEGFKKVKLKKLNDLDSILQNDSDMEKEIKKLLEKFYNKLYDFISTFKSEDYQVTNKLKFKLNRNQIIWLFKSMYDKGVISGMHINDLYRILETNSMYYDKGKYVDMVGVFRQANKFDNGHVSPAESIKVLEKIFDQNFFSSSI